MHNGLLPNYLCDLIPNFVYETASYNLRSSSELQRIHSRTVSYAKSFLPDTINLWNSLPNSRETCTLSGFRNLITKTEKINGTRFWQIIHCRLRLGCSNLSSDKYNRHLLDNPCVLVDISWKTPFTTFSLAVITLT